MTHHKRPFSGIRSSGGGTPNSNSGASGGATPIFPELSPAMKKAKPQLAATCSLEKEKNGLHPQPHHLSTTAAAAVATQSGEEDDAMLVDQEELKPGASAPVTMTGVAANLSRKKATPPQPSVKKQLVIKLVKGTVVVQFPSVKLLTGWRDISDLLLLSLGKPSLPKNFEEDTWATLKSAITAIFLKQPDPCDSEKLYQLFRKHLALSPEVEHKVVTGLLRLIEKERCVLCFDSLNHYL
ncbi:hypothetical protein BHE74_00045593 [Ensete ventricosum]|nr:hypothetical protein GW17_00026380 [Ensete ventricosum]RWW48342.1 hypothetical protein BHE74_00045593 [Ensete ventricosum]RZR94143.1 hypothetical protein BHM03_00022772 [Ensete ventricosum]